MGEFNSRKSNMGGGGGELLCEELIEEILSHLPITSLINCKYVSKSWSCLVSNVCRRVPTVGLIGLYSNLYPIMRGLGELRLLLPPMNQEDDAKLEKNIENECENKFMMKAKKRLPFNLNPLPFDLNRKGENECIMKTTKCFDIYRLTHLLDSCNGLILCQCLDGDVNNYYVGNPILHQWARLPRSTKQDHLITTIGFAFDGIQGHHYKILRLFLRETSGIITNRIQCEIFSSVTGQWRKHQATILNPLSTLGHCIKLISGPSIQKHGLYRNGALHWTFKRDDKYMLVFDVDKEVFQFIELPGDTTVNNFRVVKCLWESKGYLHYAISGPDNIFKVWKNIDHNGVDNQQRWVFIQTIRYASMVRRNLKEDPSKLLICIYERWWSSLPKNSLSVPSELNSGSRVMNLGTMLTFLSNYSGLDDEEEEDTTPKILRWRYKDFRQQPHLTCTLHPYLFNLADLPTWEGCTLLKHPNLILTWKKLISEMEGV